MLRLRFNKRLGDFELAVNIADGHGVIALFGKSGCGKSTTINLIAGLLKPDRGYFELDGEVLFDSDKNVDCPAERRRIGYVFQDARLFPHYTVRGNLEYGLRRAHGATRISPETVIQLLDLGPLLQRRPSQLSGGEKQRVALGRALLAQTRLLLLDEPLASLDLSRRNEVLPYLENIRDQLGIPMVYVSHQFDEVLQLASQVVLLERGRVVAQGTLPAISREPALRRIIGDEAIGAVIDTQVQHLDAATGLAHIAIVGQQPAQHLFVDAGNLQLGQRVRLQLLARDLILSLHSPSGLSVRNALHGTVIDLQDDEQNATLVTVDVGGVQLLARITRSAARELRLHPGMSLWVLVKAVTLRGHMYRAVTQHGEGGT